MTRFFPWIRPSNSKSELFLFQLCLSMSVLLDVYGEQCRLGLLSN
jgi:hypothetical protein